MADMSGFDLFGSGSGTSIAGSAVGAATGAATGNPIALVAGLAGIGMSLFGGQGEAKVAKEEAQVSQQIGMDEQQINQQRQNLATLTYQRQGIENMRRVQQGRALARTAAVAGGGSTMGTQAGSGERGAESQASAEGAFNAANLAQSYQIGTNIFGITSDINQKQIQLSQLGGIGAGYAGIAAIGQGLTQGAMSLGRLTGGFGAQG